MFACTVTTSRRLAEQSAAEPNLTLTLWLLGLLKFFSGASNQVRDDQTENWEMLMAGLHV